MSVQPYGAAVWMGAEKRAGDRLVPGPAQADQTADLSAAQGDVQRTDRAGAEIGDFEDRRTRGLASLGGAMPSAFPTRETLAWSSPFTIATMRLPCASTRQMLLTKSSADAFAARAASLTEWQDCRKDRCSAWTWRSLRKRRSLSS